MNTVDELKQNLVGAFIDQSAIIDQLVVRSRKASPDEKLLYDQELLRLRTDQQEIYKMLLAFDQTHSKVWENIGDGG